MHKMKNNVLRHTESICPSCSARVKASVIERDNKIYLIKDCAQHKDINILLSDNAASYKQIENFYFSVMKKNLKIWAIEIDITFRCNMNCSICAWGNDHKEKLSDQEPSLEEIKDFIKMNKCAVVRLSGGEPTCRDDLPDIIKMIKQLKKRVIINTNGLKIADRQYLLKLKKAGLDSLNITFDGFDPAVEKLIRGENYLKQKLEALKNLEELRIPTGLNIRVIQGVNEEQIPKIIDYAANNSFIKLLSFGTLSWMGEAQKWSLDKYLMPDQIVDIMIKQTQGILTRDCVRFFQKLFIAINSFFEQRWCFYDSASFILIREKGTYSSLEQHINFFPIEKWLDRYPSIYKKNPFLAKLYLIGIGFLSLGKIKSFKVFKELFLKGLSFFFKNKSYLTTNLFLYISINTSCDNYKMDYTIAENCLFAMAFKEKNDSLKFKGTAAQVCDKLLNKS